mgnify:CR=1 FL=1
MAQALFGSPDILLLDEPTNHLDFDAITWLEEFLLDFENTVITVSHDRHFLNQVCTHMADMDYGKLTVYPGNYDNYMEASTMSRAQKLKDNAEKKLAEYKKIIDNATFESPHQYPDGIKYVIINGEFAVDNYEFMKIKKTDTINLFFNIKYLKKQH